MAKKQAQLLKTPSRSELATELKRYRDERQGVLYKQWLEANDEYNTAYARVKETVLVELGVPDILKHVNELIGSNFPVSWIGQNSIAGNVITERLAQLGIVAPKQYNFHYGRSDKDRVVQADFENARKHIMLDEPMTVATALTIIEDFKNGKPIPAFKPPRDKTCEEIMAANECDKCPDKSKCQ